MSKERRINDFKNQMDYQIGKELYSKKDKGQLCKVQECNYLSETVTEYIYKLAGNICQKVLGLVDYIYQM